MNTVRSALSQLAHISSAVSFGELPIVKQFLKGVFQQKPALTKIHRHWGPFYVVKLFQEFILR